MGCRPPSEFCPLFFSPLRGSCPPDRESFASLLPGPGWAGRWRRHRVSCVFRGCVECAALPRVPVLIGDGNNRVGHASTCTPSLPTLLSPSSFCVATWVLVCALQRLHMNCIRMHLSWGWVRFCMVNPQITPPHRAFFFRPNLKGGVLGGCYFFSKFYNFSKIHKYQNNTQNHLFWWFFLHFFYTKIGIFLEAR